MLVPLPAKSNHATQIKKSFRVQNGSKEIKK